LGREQKVKKGKDNPGEGEKKTRGEIGITKGSKKEARAANRDDP